MPLHFLLRSPQQCSCVLTASLLQELRAAGADPGAHLSILGEGGQTLGPGDELGSGQTLHTGCSNWFGPWRARELHRVRGLALAGAPGIGRWEAEGQRQRAARAGGGQDPLCLGAATSGHKATAGPAAAKWENCDGLGAGGRGGAAGGGAPCPPPRLLPSVTSKMNPSPADLRYSGP